MPSSKRRIKVYRIEDNSADHDGTFPFALLGPGDDVVIKIGGNARHLADWAFNNFGEEIEVVHNETPRY